GRTTVAHRFSTPRPPISHILATSWRMSGGLSANSVLIQRSAANSERERQGPSNHIDLPHRLTRCAAAIAQHLPAQHIGPMMTTMTNRARATTGLIAAAAMAATLAIAVT